MAIGVAILALAAYLVLCAAFLWFLVLPLLGWIVLVAVVAGVVLALVVVLGAPFAADAEVAGPDDVARPRRLRHHPDAYGREAWPHYLALQARLDLAAMVAAPRAVLGALWGRTRRVTEVPALAFGWPIGLVAAVVLVVGSASAVVTAVLLVALAAVLLGVAAAVWAGVGLVVGGVDRLLRRRNRAQGSCPACYYVTDLPGYPCTSCGTVHRDVSPGRLGVLGHRCRCGDLMPTTVSRAGATHTPLCPNCDRVLEVGSGIVTDVRIPVFGPVSAGKTSLVYAGLAALDDALSAGDGTLEVLDGGRARFDDGVAQVRAGRTTKTDAHAPPLGLVTRVSSGRRTALLHTFDAAGEFFSDRVQNADLRFLDHARQMIVVVDPFSVPVVVDELRQGPDDVADAAPATEPPVSAYRTTVQRLRDTGVRLDRCALAVVLVKADLLVRLPVAAGLRADPASVRAWLAAQDQDHLVVEAERDFADVGYFLVSSVTGTTAADPHTAAAPFLWLGARARLPVPAAA